MRDLPSSWRWVELGKVLTSIEAGKSFKAEQRPALPNEKGVLKISALTWGKFQSEENKALLPDTDIDGVPTVQAGDLLISRANTVELVGAVAMADKEYPHLLLSDKTLRLKPDLDAAHSRYLLYVLRTSEARRHIESHATGTSGSMRNITQVNIRKIPIPLPPLEEQRRIAAILDKADGVRRKQKEAIALTEELLRSVFLDMFGDPVTNPNGWEVVDLGSLLKFLTSGSRGWAKYYAEKGSLFLRIQNVKAGRLLLDDIAFVNAPDSAEAKRTCVQEGDVLVSITADLGRTAVIPKDIGKAYINQHLALLRLDIKRISPTYAAAFLTSIGGQIQFDRLNREGVKAGLNFDDLRGLKMLLPPLEKQLMYLDFLDSQTDTLQRQKAAHTDSDNLFNSLLQRAFRGEL